MGAALQGGGRNSRRNSRYGGRTINSEINVTPFVDVMLVLLVIFMVSAPLLTIGVPVNLPKAAAPTLNEQVEPISVTVSPEGGWFVGELAVSGDAELREALNTASDGDSSRKVFLRGDTTLSYGDVMGAMAAITRAGYTKLALISDAPTPSAGN